MLKHTITYKDFNGTQRTEDLYFNLSEQELIDIQTESTHGIEKELQDAVDDNDMQAVLDFIKKLIHLSYGIKSEDGRFFRKSPEILFDFVSSAYYSNLLLSLFSDGGQPGIEFIQGVMPPELVKQAMAQVDSQRGAPADHISKQDVDSAPVFTAEVTTTENPSYLPNAREIIAEQKKEHDRIEQVERDEFERWKASQRAEVAPKTLPGDNIDDLHH